MLAAIVAIVLSHGIAPANWELTKEPSTRDGLNETDEEVSAPPGYNEFLNELKSDVRGGVTMSPAAAETYKQHQADANRQKELGAAREEMIRGILGKAFGENAVDRAEIQNFIELNKAPDEYAGKHLLVFVSSSMPDAGIKNLLAILGNNSATAFILRGVIGNDVSKIMPTQAWVKGLVCPGDDAAQCYKAPFDINPVLFERLSINEVPAIAYVPDPEGPLDSCNPVEFSEEPLIYYGDYSPLYALEKFLELRPEDEVLKDIHKDVAKKGFFHVIPSARGDG